MSLTFLHSSRGLSYDRFTTSSKTNSPVSAIQCFLLQLPVSPLFLKIMQQLLTSSSSSCHPFPASFNNVFQKAVSTQVVTNPVSLPSFYFMQDIPLLLNSTQYFFILTRSVQLIFSSATFQNFRGISYTFSEMFKFHHRMELCSKCSISLVSFFKILCYALLFFREQ